MILNGTSANSDEGMVSMSFEGVALMTPSGVLQDDNIALSRYPEPIATHMPHEPLINSFLFILFMSSVNRAIS